MVLTNLRELNCRYNALDHTPLPRFESLSKLHLRNDIDEDNLVLIAAIPNLLTLDLSGCPDLPSLAPLSSCIRLQYLSLKDTPANDLSPLTTCIDLISINIRDTHALFSDLVILTALPLLQTIHCEIDDSFLEGMTTEDLFRLVATKSPCVDRITQMVFEAIIDQGVKEEEISQELKGIFLSPTSSPETLALAVKILLGLCLAVTSDYKDEFFESFLHQSTFIPLIKIFLFSAEKQVQVQLMQIFAFVCTNQVDCMQADNLDTALTFFDSQIITLLATFITPGNMDEEREYASTLLARISCASDIHFEYLCEEEEELRAKMNKLRALILSQPFLLDSLMNMIDSGNPRLRYRAFQVLENCAGDHDYNVAKVGRTDVTCYNENSALIVAHPGLLTRLYKIMESESQDEREAASPLIGVLGSHDRTLAGQVVERMQEILIKNADSNLASVIWTLDYNRGAQWTNELLASKKHKDLKCALALVDAFSGMLWGKDLFDSPIPSLLLLHLQEKKNSLTASEIIEAIDSLLRAGRGDDFIRASAAKFAALPGDLISLLIECLGSKREKVVEAAIGALESLSHAEANRIFVSKLKRVTTLPQFLATLLEPSLASANKDLTRSTLRLLNQMAKGNKKRISVIGCIPRILNSLLSLASGSSSLETSSSLDLLATLAEDEKLASKIFSLPKLFQCLSNFVYSQDIYCSLPSLKLLVFISTNSKDQLKIWGNWIIERGLIRTLTSQKSSSEGKMHAATILMNLAGNATVRAKINKTEAVKVLTGVRSQADADETQLKRTVTAALKKIRS